MYEEDLFDIEAQNLEKIVEKLTTNDLEIRQIYFNAVLNKVCSDYKTQNQKNIKDIYQKAVAEEDYECLGNLGEFMKHMVAAKSVEMVNLLLTELWVELFGSLEYSIPNYDHLKKAKSFNYLEFIQDDKMKVIEGQTNKKFSDLVRLRQRAIFLFDYAMVLFFSEENAIFVAQVLEIDSVHDQYQHATAQLDPQQRSAYQCHLCRSS